MIRCLKQAAALRILAAAVARAKEALRKGGGTARGERARRLEPSCVSAAGRQRASEVTGSGSALPADGRRGSLANHGAKKSAARAAPDIRMTEAATAKNCGIGKRDSAARTARPAIGNRLRTKMPRGAASAPRRLASAEEADWRQDRSSPASKWTFPQGRLGQPRSPLFFLSPLCRACFCLFCSWV